MKNSIRNTRFKVIRNMFFFLAFISSSAIYSQSISADFFAKADGFFKTHVQNGKVNYADAKNSQTLKELVATIENVNDSGASDLDKKAFYINAYNILVINAATQAYPLASVNDIPGFFDRKKHTVAGESTTLNKLEKEKLLKATNDARLHFVLVCGAIDCPPIVNFAYTPEKLNAQMEKQTQIALNNPAFIKIAGNEVQLSKIFQWYVGDFGGSQRSVIEFINKYRNSKISAANKISYYEYDWTLNNGSAGHSSVTNSVGANAARYVVSAAIPKGSFEIKLFNNLYTQKTGSVENLTDRSTFFTSTLSALYGVTNRFNAGIETKYRRVNYSNLPSSPLAVLSGNAAGDSRAGITGFGPKVRIAPFEKLENFSIQSTLIFPIGQDLAGNNDLRYIDWPGPIFNTQLFNDFSIGNSFSLFTEVDFLLEDIGKVEENHINRFSTPATAIFSYFPNPKTTFYVLGSFSPYYQTDFDYFAQAGLGTKYQITPAFEVELLYTAFTNKFLLDTGGNANTFNLGIRYSL